uniref:Uncharacterized protein n=1 Tax=Plectus sambesii TaxID=2011161 RepID=A0A914WNW0_9BILA
MKAESALYLLVLPALLAAQLIGQPNECTHPADISWLRGMPVAFYTYVNSTGTCQFRVSTNVGRRSRNVFYSIEACVQTCCPSTCWPTCCKGYWENKR